ncbi:DUF58 domain-containing protein [Stratiformator vulcanicus]|uniref:DUF58 domain-containing protein n=1 Tax=Stratiformator vulcanicus TaxID=2527980 RepID=A0A517R5D4_9PLAN|nr:DUF58 domain-containing protein [Stratiformator vulcanicus]QDT39107.1 hypothetical protein Pan189_35090 [Stratiformator vulcanicus]
MLTQAELLTSSTLALRARHLVRGMQLGRHRGIGRGPSSEFFTHRPYSPGDEPRRIDWKLFARTRRHFYKETREDSSVRVLILLDASGSMGAIPAGDDRESKWKTAAILAAAIARVTLRQGDPTALTIFADNEPTELPCTDRPSHWNRIVDAMAEATPQGVFAADLAAKRVAGRFSRRGLIYLMTDGWDDPAQLNRSLSTLATRGHDVRLLRVIDAAEERLPTAEQVRFRDPESTRILQDHATELAPAYRRAVAEHHRLVRSACLRHNATIVTVRTGDDLLSRLRLSLAGRTERSAAS